MNLFEFWDKQYRIEDDELRVSIAHIFTEEFARRGWNRRLSVQLYRHPMIRRKTRRRYAIVEILADFILRPVQKAERAAVYPIKNADADWYADNKRRKREISYDAFEEGGGQFDVDRKMYVPKEKNIS